MKDHPDRKGRLQLIEAMFAGHLWQSAVAQSQLHISRSTAYRLRQLAVLAMAWTTIDLALSQTLREHLMQPEAKQSDPSMHRQFCIEGNHPAVHLLCHSGFLHFRDR